jgi:predicted DCC family thiol-disulfide oxidoreductase YuxK
MVTIGSGLLIFDGDCGFCTSSAGWMSRRWPPGRSAVAWQQLGADGLADLGLTPAQAQQAAWWVDAGRRRFRGHRAIGKSLLAGNGWLRAIGGAIMVPPLSWCAAAGYAVVVRYRYRLPGGTPACRVPGPGA